MAEKGSFLEKISPRQAAAARLMALGKTNNEIHEEIGISLRQLTRWRKRRDFLEAVYEAQSEVFDHALSVCLDASIEAVNCLRQVCNNPEAPDSARVAAARSILEVAGDRLVLARLQAKYEELAEELHDPA